MNRREALQNVGLLLGGTIVGGTVFLESGCKSDKKVNALFTESDVALLDEIAETILPKTATPGAKDAKVGAFMAMMVVDCYSPKDQQVFTAGLKKLDEVSKEKNSAAFMKASPEQRTSLLVALDKEQQDYMSKKQKDEPYHYFRMMKELSLLGFFTSEVGATKALRYIAVPGRYEGSVPYKKGDRAWATA
jgi:hypothetical protein